jgi:hypothetical protein
LPLIMPFQEKDAEKCCYIALENLKLIYIFYI